MSAFSSDLLHKIGVPPEYFSEASLHEYVVGEAQLRRSLIDTEFDCYSDASVDTSSFSVNSSEYLNWAMRVKSNQPLREESLGTSLMQYGRSTLTNSESTIGSLWSDDDMSELLPFDQPIRFSPQKVDEWEGRRYLSRLLRQEMEVAEFGWCYPDAMEDSQLNMDRTMHKIRGDFFLEPRYLRNDFRENIIPNRDDMHHKEGVEDLYFNSVLVRNYADSIATPRNPNSRGNNSVTRDQAQVLKEEIQNTKPGKESLDNVVSKKKKKVKPLKSTENDEQRVFLGGLPIGITERMVRQHLAALGYKVLKRPKILHGFAPEVWMKTVDQAQDLIEKGKIMIEGVEVEVRPYNSWTKLSELKKLPNVGQRSVFIRGLSTDTTTKNLQDVLSEMGMKVINYPVIKNGFARQVILDTISQARTLINMKKIQVNGTFVDVRPFVNYRRKRRNK